MSHPSSDIPGLDAWLAALEARQLADLRFAEVTRALRALSSAYVERRGAGAHAGALDSAGKRAAFALFYGPLHFIATWHAVQALGLADAGVADITDLGCGTGVVGAAWALAAGGRATITGIDRHPWAIDESRWTWGHFGLAGRGRVGDLARTPAPRPGGAVVAGWALNELGDAARRGVEAMLLKTAEQGGRVLVLEPIARSATPWWDDTAKRLAPAGFRADEWLFPVRLPERLALLDKAAGLNHSILKLRTLSR